MVRKKLFWYCINLISGLALLYFVFVNKNILGIVLSLLVFLGVTPWQLKAYREARKK